MGVHVNPNTISVFNTLSDTRQCSVKYKMIAGCMKMQFYCDRRFYLENKDVTRCLRGDTLYVKTAGTKRKPLRFCKQRRPTKGHPVLAEGDLKVWYRGTPKKRYPNKGATCYVQCIES